VAPLLKSIDGPKKVTTSPCNARRVDYQTISSSLTSESNVVDGWPFGASIAPPVVGVPAGRQTLYEGALGTFGRSFGHSSLVAALVGLRLRAGWSARPRYKREAPIAMIITELHGVSQWGVRNLRMAEELTCEDLEHLY
jgi:hypothetical protein